MFFNSNSSLRSKIRPITNPQDIKQACGGLSNFIFSNHKDELYAVRGTEKSKISIDLKNDSIMTIDHGYYNCLVLTFSGLVYSIGKDNSYKELPLEDVTGLDQNKAYLCTWFVKNKLKIKKIVCTSVNNYFLTYENVLYGNGLNGQGQLVTGDMTNRQQPVIIAENVSDVFGSPHSNHNFYTTYDDKLIGLGYNNASQLGLNDTSIKSIKRVVPNISGNEIKRISCPNQASIILFKNGTILSCGSARANGRNGNSKNFIPIPQLKKIKCQNIVSGSAKTMILTMENDVYGLNFPDVLVAKLENPNLPQNINFDLASSLYCFFIFPDTNKNKSRNMDFLILLETGDFSDYTLKNYNLKIHKSFVESRIGKPIEEIEQKLYQSEYNKKEIRFFFKWVYSGIIEDYRIVNQICNEFKISGFLEKSFRDDLLKLYNDEDSKNFNLLVKIDDDNYNETEEEEEEEYFEEIPVHKFVLYARSGLFRDMFQNVNEESNSVKDFSGKTIESLEILIKFFYTGSIELTADHDPELIVEELNDSIEYYQLNENSTLKYELFKIKDQYNLK
ncbi:hypothetical protein M0813_08023 [Anaeramoeba flamelloides]|uniref:BTB domain-containing protein n=1 Tax=Anaeramoeba flamelloides TaxID=1746091 RepID=A0ABQ8X8U1_9EUKA|nr:hypothetical protein M0813_08023 [Anaeramoeba flamelloides]